ncbi:peptidoglycan-binding protein [Actinomycetota bacterium]
MIRTITSTVTALGLAATAFATAHAAPAAGDATATTTALPVVNMALVEVAADVEGKYGNQPLGDDASTRLVQSAIRARGISTSVDGWYGRGTNSAYRTWQRKLGYSGIDANGLPGPGSLGKLGANRFTIAHKVDIGSRHDNYRGVRVNTRTKKMLAAADAKVPFAIYLSQGSYRYPNGASASAGTHDGGGVVDISVGNMTTTQRWQAVKALRQVGFAAWYRTSAQGFTPHIHAVAIGDTDLWQANGLYTNRDQVGDYYKGRTGLASNGPDNTPTSYRVPFTWWERYAGL